MQSPWVPLVGPREQTHSPHLWVVECPPPRSLFPVFPAPLGSLPLELQGSNHLEPSEHGGTRHSHRPEDAKGSVVWAESVVLPPVPWGVAQRATSTCGRGGLGGGLQGWWSSRSREKAAVRRGGQNVSFPCQAAGPQLCGVDGLMSCREWVSTCNVPPLPHTLSRTSCKLPLPSYVWGTVLS